MAKVGIENYKTGTKNNWRHQCWNEISSRVKNKRNATVLYLAAEQDLDRSVAIRRGFQANNLIAVDMRRSVVDQLREKSKIAVQGRIEHVACAWADVDVVYADFCCGLTADAMRAFQAMTTLPLIKNECVFLFNFQRGREHAGAAEWIKLQQGLIEADGSYRSIYMKDKKNRAMLAVQMVSSWLTAIYSASKFGHKEMLYDGRSASIVKSSYHSVGGVSCADLAIKQNANPAFITYKSSSGNLYFDTVIMGKTVQLAEEEKEKCISELYASSDEHGFFKSVLGCRGRVAAAKAVRTMRKNGTLAPCSNF